MPKLNEPLQDPIGKPLHAAIDWDSMTDDEIMSFLNRTDTTDKYSVQHLAPDGMTYQWVRCEVFGKPDYDRPAEVERMGWRPVPASRHEGRFAPPGTQGPAILDGQMLYELPSRIVRLKREVESKRARTAVGDMNEQLIYTPPGTGPRGTHGYTKPILNRESGAMPMVVE
jgi:hypothetical protein